MANQTIGLVVDAVGTTGVLHQVTGVIARHQGDITSVEILANRPEKPAPTMKSFCRETSTR